MTRRQRLEAATGYSTHTQRRIAAYAGRTLGALTDAEVIDLVSVDLVSVYLVALDEIAREERRRARRPVRYRYDARGRLRAIGGAA